MHRIKLAITVFFLLIGAAFGSTPESSSWRVTVHTGPHSSELGSATAVGPQIMVTAGHMSNFKAGVDMDLSRPDGQKVHGHTIAASTDPVDMAVIQLDAPVTNWVGIGSVPSVGGTVTDYGYGHLGILRTATGRVTKSDQYEFQSDIDIEQGDSGGGVFDSTGNLVGVTVACTGRSMTQDGQAHMGPDVATRIDWIQKFTNVSCGPGGCSPRGVPPPSGIPMVPVPTAPAAPIQQLPTPPMIVAPGGSPRDDIQDQRLNRLEGIVNQLGPSIGLQPLAPLGPNVVPVAPAPTPDAIGNALLPKLQPLFDQLKQDLNNQLLGLGGAIVNNQGTVADNLGTQIGTLNSNIKNNLPAIAGQVVSQINAHPEIITGAIAPLLSGLGVPGWVATGVSGVGLALLGLLVHSKLPSGTGTGGTSTGTVAQPQPVSSPPQIVPFIVQSPQATQVAGPVQSGQPNTVVVQAPPLPQATTTQTAYVPYETNYHDQAYENAKQTLVQRNPGMAGTFQAADSLINQFLAGAGQPIKK